MTIKYSYEYLSILDMCPKDAFAHLLKFGIVKKRETPLLGWANREKHFTKITIDYLYSDWVCLVENGICTDVWPISYEGEL